ncbi:MAG: hypothetical protein HC836_19610 [Richelia sp. RM2_1_2]|nr:hypothetical protein [Richelia sp. RM1_1_1]NJO60392.1 hypothetical protein [Richelia sp. RM2_1_2]
MTLDIEPIPKDEMTELCNFTNACHDFKIWLKRKFQLRSIEAYVLAKTLIENYYCLLEDNHELLNATERNADYIRQKYSPDETA